MTQILQQTRIRVIVTKINSNINELGPRKLLVASEKLAQQ